MNCYLFNIGPIKRDGLHRILSVEVADWCKARGYVPTILRGGWPEESYFLTFPTEEHAFEFKLRWL